MSCRGRRIVIDDRLIERSLNPTSPFLPFFSDGVFHFDKSLEKGRIRFDDSYVDRRSEFFSPAWKYDASSSILFPDFERFSSSRWNTRAGEDRSSSPLVHCISVAREIGRMLN